MSDEFDPYYAWLGIPPKDQPPNHYRLLGVELFESNLDVIESAAFRQMGHVRTYQGGQRSRESQQLLNELSAAKICLLAPEQKDAYDQQLRATVEAITAFLPDESIDPVVPTEVPNSESDSIHVIDVEPRTTAADSAMTRRASVAAIRRKSTRHPKRFPIAVIVIAVVLGAGGAVMFGRKFLQSDTPVVNLPPITTPAPPTIETTTAATNDPTEEPTPTNGTLEPSPALDNNPGTVATPNNASPNRAPAIPATRHRVAALNDSTRSFPQFPTRVLQGRIRFPLMSSLRESIEQSGGIANNEFAFTQTMPYDEFLSIANRLRNIGYRPLRIRPYLVDGESRIACVWTRDAIDWRMVIGVDSSVLNQANQVFEQRGFRPLDVACWEADGTKYAAVWDANQHRSGPHELMLGVRVDRFAAATAAARARGLMPLSHHVSYNSNGKAEYSVVWHAPEKVMPWHHWDDDRKAHESSLQRPGAPQDVCLGYQANGALTYGGLLIGSPDPDALELHGYDAEDHRIQCQDLVSKGYRPIAVAAAAKSGEQQIITASIWQRGDAPSPGAIASTPASPTTINASAAVATHALRFDGNALVTVTNSKELATRQSTFTAEMWFRCTEPKIEEGYVLMGTTAHRDPPAGSNVGTASGWHVTAGRMQGQTDGQETALRYASAAGGIRGSGASVQNLGTGWHHLAVCNAPVDGNYQLEVFLDGTRTQSNKRNLNDAIFSVTDFFLGKAVYIPDRHAFLGDVKAFRLSSKVRYRDPFSPPQVFTSDDTTLALLNFDGKSTSSVADVSGNLRHGTITGAKWINLGPPPSSSTPQPTTNKFAKATHAIRCDGSDSIMIANSRDLALVGSAFTAEMWFRFIQPTPRRAYVLMGTSAYKNRHPEVTSTETTGWFVIAGRRTNATSQSTGLRWAGPEGRIIGIEGGVPPLGDDWHHLAVCNTPMGATEWQMQVFADGHRTQSVTRDRNEASPSPSDFFLGASPFLSDRHEFQGDIKAFRLSSNVRYKSDFSPPKTFASDSSTLALLDFSGANSSNIQDVSGNNRHGNIRGAKWVRVDSPSNIEMAATPEPAPLVQSASRLVVPATDKRSASSKKVKDIFATDFEAAKDKPAKIALAKDLLQRGQEEQDPAAKFALLFESRALMLEAADLYLALQTTDELSSTFEVDPWVLKCDTLTKLAASANSDADRHPVATTSLELADEAIGNSDWGSATKLLAAASRANLRLKDREILRIVNQKRKQVQANKKLWDEAEQAATLLATSPDDASANWKLGRYRCFVKGDWDTGLPHLAKGSKEELAKLAKQDTQNPQGSAALALANAWYEWGEAASDSDKNGALLRAKHWYTSALPNLAGLDRTVATKKLEGLQDKVEETSTPGKQMSWLDGPVGELKRLEGHAAEVTSLDVSRSGTMLVSGSSDGTVRFWNLADGKETGQIRSSVSRVNKVALIRDDQFVLVAGSRTTAEVWNVRTGRPATSMTIPSSIRDAALSADDKLLVCARGSSSSGNLSVYNMGTGAVAGKLNCPSYPYSATISRTGRFVAAGSGDNNIYVWNLASGKIASPFAGLGSTPVDVAISPNEQLVAACASNQVMVWELANGKMLSRSPSSSRTTSQLVFSPDSRRLLCAGMMHEVSIINVEDGKVIQTLTGKTSGGISTARAVAYLPDPRGAVSSGYDGVIRIWRLPD
ncbi:MAG: hypothetical protein H8E66_26090 [Planctomycetes bacterium]|nr:hypothetical protein [Planctomycetota bacterium]